MVGLTISLQTFSNSTQYNELCSMLSGHVQTQDAKRFLPIYTQSGQNRPDNSENILLTKVLSGKYLKEKC